jgi:hypothetical protein
LARMKLGAMSILLTAACSSITPGSPPTPRAPDAKVTFRDYAARTVQICGASDADDLAIARTVCDNPEATNCQLGTGGKTTSGVECCTYSCVFPADAGL